MVDIQSVQKLKAKAKSFLHLHILCVVDIQSVQKLKAKAKSFLHLHILCVVDIQSVQKFKAKASVEGWSNKISRPFGSALCFFFQVSS